MDPGLRRLLPLPMLLLAFAASPALAERAAWDQERMTALSKELVERANDVYDAIQKGPQSTIGSGQASSFYRLKHDVRLARIEAKHLATRVQAGAGYAETLPAYENLMQTVRSAAENARRMFMPEPTLDAITAAGNVLGRIAPYYRSDAREVNPALGEADPAGG